MNPTDLFLKYVTFDTQSNESSDGTPSTEGQMVFAKEIVKQLQEIGMQEIGRAHV